MLLGCRGRPEARNAGKGPPLWLCGVSCRYNSCATRQVTLWYTSSRRCLPDASGHGQVIEEAQHYGRSLRGHRKPTHLEQCGGRHSVAQQRKQAHKHTPPALSQPWHLGQAHVFGTCLRRGEQQNISRLSLLARHVSTMARPLTMAICWTGPGTSSKHTACTAEGTTMLCMGRPS